MFRSLLIYLSQNELARRFTMGFPLSKRMSRRFIAGETLDSAIGVIRTLNASGIMATLDHLGENVKTEDDAAASAEAYVGILEEIRRSGVDSNVSLKLTQMGLDLGEELAERNVGKIVSTASANANFVRIDIEGSPYTEKTLSLFFRLRKRYKNVGCAIQSYLYRSEKDVETIIEDGAGVRLCKGAYKESAAIAYPKKSDVDANYIRLAEMLLSEKARIRGVYAAFATHDEKIIEEIKAFASRTSVPKGKFEFQMLHGIRRDLQRKLVEEGYRVRVYVPYGDQWYPYFMRRLAERPANFIFLLKNILID